MKICKILVVGVRVKKFNQIKIVINNRKYNKVKEVVM